MHDSSMLRMKWFVDHYIENGKTVLDIGSYNVNGCYRDLFNDKDIDYTGLDIEDGPNVDVIMKNPYSWDNLEDNYFDYIISGQAFEHIEYPWLTIKEVYKKLKPGGIVCIIAPNGGHEHRYPVDCWRFFGDGLVALAKWADLEVIDVSVAGIPEKNVSMDWDCAFNDACLIAMKRKEGFELTNASKLKYERRYNKEQDHNLRYEFLVRWINSKDRKNKIAQFLEEKNCNNVYVYGYGYIGQIFLEESKTIEHVKWNIIDKNKTIKLDGICSCEWGHELKQTLNSMMVITVLDSNRNFRDYLDTVYNGIPKYYIDEII